MSRRLLPILLIFFANISQAENWPQFRGLHFNGSSDETSLPARWSTTENVLWAADLPGAAAATPIVWDDRVFISSTDSSSDALCALCLDRRSGETLWRHDVAHGIRKDSRSNFAAPTPATNGEVVVFFYGNGDLIAFDMDGGELWKRNLQEDYGQFAFQWTFSSSPLLFQGRLYMQVLQRDSAADGNESYLLALDPNDGRELWRVARPSKAQMESREAFTTPVPWEYQGREELLVAGGDAISGHDPVTGQELWRWGTWNPTRIGHWRLVPSPVAGGGVILACAPKRSPIYAVRAGGNGELSDSSLAWVSRENRAISSDVPTPAFADGDFFVLSDVAKSLSRVEPVSGRVKWTVSTPGLAKYEASPLVADGKVYIVNFSSHVVVFDAANGEELSDIEMDQPRDDAVRSSIVAAQGRLFVRTTNKLFCIGR